MSELVRAFDGMGHEQAVVGGVYLEDEVCFPEGVQFYPIFFKSEELNFAIPGMSDEMPYESVRYRDMTEEMVAQYKKVFLKHITKAVEEFRPDLIVCHHLYLMTAIVCKHFPNCKIIGISHGTDVRQMKQTPLARDYIRSQIPKLDAIFALQESQCEEIKKVYGLKNQEPVVIGIGYNGNIFYRKKLQQRENVQKKIIFAGKLSYKKGVMSLLKAMNYLQYKEEDLILSLAGGHGNEDEYREICKLAVMCKYPVQLLGRLEQSELAEKFRESDVFVLPSFYEGLPLVIVEALACGANVVASDIPGVRPWIDAHIPGNQIEYVALPAIENADEPVTEELPEYERRLAHAIEISLCKKGQKADVSSVSWTAIAEKILSV